MKKILQIITTIMIFLAIAGAIIWHVWKVNQLQEQIQQQTGAHSSRVAFLSDSLSNVVQVLDRKGDTLQKARQTIITLENALQMGLFREQNLHDKYMKETEVVASLQEKIEVLNKPGEYLPPDDGSPTVTPTVPLNMEFTDPWFYARVTAFEDRPYIDSLRFLNYPKLSAGWTKEPGLKNIFASPVAEVYYENDNPYAELVDIEYIRIDPEQSWYQTSGFKVGAGFVLGAGFVVTLINVYK
jgi:hypothetical protein